MTGPTKSYVPMRTMMVVLIVEVPVGETTPAEWDWADLTDMSDEDIRFDRQELIRTYNRDIVE